MTFGATDIVRLVLGIVFGALVLCLLLVFAINKTPRARFRGAMKVIGVFALGLAGAYYVVVAGPEKIAQQEAAKKGDPSQQEHQERYAKAKALFDERCKTAGERIYKTAHGVEDLMLINMRKKRIGNWASERNYLDDLYSRDYGGDGVPGVKNVSGFDQPDEYVLSFLKPDNSYLDQNKAAKLDGLYKYVYWRSDDKNHFYRYRHELVNAKNLNSSYGDWVVTSRLIRDVVTLKREPNYGVEWRDISTKEDRDNWIAGGGVWILKMPEREVLAERIGYVFDTGMGSSEGGRSPWSWAQSYGPRCPSPSESTADFVAKVLKNK